MPFLTSDDVAIHHKTDGDGDQTVLLVAGLGDDLTFWDGLVPQLVGAGLRVLRFDNRGVGRSDVPNGPYSTAQLAGDAAALIRQTGVGPVHVVGISMGGMIAQELALACPEMVRSVVLAATAARLDPYADRLFRLWDDLLDVPGGFALVLRDDPLRCLTTTWIDEHDAELAASDAERAVNPPPITGYRGQLTAILAHDAADRLDRITAPTCVIAAAEDMLIPTHLGTALAMGIKGAELHVLPGGHALPIESPDAFNHLVVEFIGRAQARLNT
jgi:3-oxoadipate enol-lactonase